MSDYGSLMAADINDILTAIRNVKVNPDLQLMGNKLIIYGAGNFGKDVFLATVRKGFSVIAFLDQNAKSGDHYQDIPILRPDDSRISQEEKANIPVVLAVHNRDVEIYPIIESLKTYGYFNALTPVILFDLCGDEIGDRYWLTSRSYYRQQEDAIRECFSVWDDDASRNLYRDILKYRITGNFDTPSIPDRRCQYVPADIPTWEKPLRFIDCGSYNGDTIRQFLDMGIPIEALAAFEPDPDNFLKLTNFIREKEYMIDDIALWPCGVYASTDRIAFTSGIGESAKLCPLGNTIVQCVALDDVIPHFRPNLIKMDVEGAELDALLGARKTIRENIPGLAICVYHRPADLWQIPLMIRQWDCGYEFYLRLHAYNGFDLVMYAVKR